MAGVLQTAREKARATVEPEVEAEPQAPRTRWLSTAQPRPTRADQWPAAPSHGHLWKITR